MTKLKWVFLTGLIVTIASCGSKEKKIKKAFDAVNEKSAKDLAFKYNAISNWDSIAEYSFVYEEMFIDDNRYMLLKGRICDIAREDSIYVIKLVDVIEDGSPKYLSYITFKSKYKARFFKDYKSRIGTFIIRITKVTTSIPSISADAEIEDNEAYAYTYLGFNEGLMLTIFKGELIDYSLDIVYPNE